MAHLPKGQGIIPMPPFMSWLSNNIPAVYDNTMTYYEELCSLIKYLEDVVVPAVNANAEALTVVSNALEQLKQYVDNYFANLDVQEEINNKLDQMAEDGTLQEIITAYIQANVAWTFDTVAEMVAGENLINGSFAQTLGYNAKNDGGAGLYKIRTITNDDVVDGGAIVEMADNTLVAELIYKDSIKPEQYGCYGDGTHDDTTQFKKLITFVTSKGLPLVGDGSYLLNESITLGDIDIIMPLAKLSTNYGITINGATNRTLNLPKVISSITNANYAGITMFECYTNQVTVNYVEGFTKGLLMTSTEHGCVYNIVNIGEIRNCLNSIVLEGQDNGWVNQNLFLGGRVINDTTYTSTYGSDIVKISLLGTSVHGINNNMFINTCIEGDEGSSNGLKLKLRYASLNKFECVRFEGQNAKIDALNSNENIISNGYNVNSLTFTNDSVSYQVEGTTYNFPKGGRISNVLIDAGVTSNAYPIIQCRNSAHEVGFKILNDGFEVLQQSNGNKQLKVNANGISGFDSSQNMYTMIRSYGGNNLLCNADGTNHCLCIGSSTNTTGAAFLWVYDGHLYGKMGSKPSTTTDGTVIL